MDNKTTLQNIFISHVLPNEILPFQKPQIATIIIHLGQVNDGVKSNVILYALFIM